jgi:hypothetical protein
LIPCHQCKALTKRSDAACIEVKTRYGFEDTERWFCKPHAPPCDWIDESEYQQSKMFKKPQPVEVNELGAPKRDNPTVRHFATQEWVTQQVCRVEMPVLVVTNYVTNQPIQTPPIQYHTNSWLHWNVITNLLIFTNRGWGLDAETPARYP